MIRLMKDFRIHYPKRKKKKPENFCLQSYSKELVENIFRFFCFRYKVLFAPFNTSKGVQISKYTSYADINDFLLLFLLILDSESEGSMKEIHMVNNYCAKCHHKMDACYWRCFPRDPDKRAKWKNILHLEEVVDSARFCPLHFKHRDSEYPEPDLDGNYWGLQKTSPRGRRLIKRKRNQAEKKSSGRESATR